MLKTVQKCLFRTCVWYTVVSVLFLLAGIVSGVGNFTPGAVSFLLMLPMSLCISAAGLLLKYEKLNGALRRLIHFVTVILSVFLFLILPNNTTMQPATVLIVICGMSALYWLLFGMVHLFGKRFRRILED